MSKSKSLVIHFLDLSEILERNDIFQNNKDVFAVKFFELLPSSCNTLNSLATADGVSVPTGIVITHEQTLQYNKKHCGKTRFFKISIYRLTNKEDGKVKHNSATNKLSLKPLYMLRRKNLLSVICKIRNMSFN